MEADTMSRPETCRIAAMPADYQRYGIAKGEIAAREDEFRTRPGGPGTFEWWSGKILAGDGSLVRFEKTGEHPDPVTGKPVADTTVYHYDGTAHGGQRHNRGTRVPGRVGERFGADVIRRHLDRLRQPSHRGNIELDRDRGPAGQRPQGRAQAALGQDRRVDAAGDLPQVLLHLVQLADDPADLGLQPGQPGRHHALCQAQLQAERDQPLLGLVV